jgi:hypothetical protein
MRVIETTVYTFDELSEEAKQSAFEYVRNNWHDLSQHCIDDLIGSLKALQEEIGGGLDYSISAVPDRGEFITFEGFDKDALESLDEDSCPLTGMCYDIDVIRSLKGDYLHCLLTMIHNETDYLYSDEALSEMLQANSYEFTADGKTA